MKFVDDLYYSGLALVCAAMLLLGSFGMEDPAGFSASDSLQTSISDTAAVQMSEDNSAVLPGKE